jgi:glycosyltransferase EpsD
MPLEKVSVLISGFEAQPIVLTNQERISGRADIGAGPDDFILVNLARFWPEKAHEVLLDAFLCIRRERRDARLWLAGVGPTQEQTRRKVSELGLTPFVQFLGFRRDLPYVLALADLQVHPSHAEGIPLALCSGMAAGIPIVATRVGGVPEIIRHGDTGILVEAGRPEAVAKAVLNLMANPHQRRQIGEGARRFILEEYSLEQAGELLEAVYEDLLR